MKKVIAFLMALSLFSVLVPCVFAEAKDYSDYSVEELLTVLADVHDELARRQPSSAAPEEILQGLKTAGLDLEITTVFTEETDLNHLLGRPGCYTGKADFSIGAVEKNTIETFDTAEDCDARYAYLAQYSDASLGPFGLEQYMYKSAFAILRISYDITPSDAEPYETAFYALVSQGN